MEGNELKKKGNYSVIIAIVLTIAVIGIIYLGITLYSNYKNDDSDKGSNEVEYTAIEKIAFEVTFNAGDKVSDLKLNIKANGSVTEYSYDNFNIYKVDSNDYNTCDISSTHTKLSSSYVLKSNEKYVVEIEELKFKNMIFNDGFTQAGNSFSVNDVSVNDLKKWCTGSKYEDGKSLSFEFELPTSISEEEPTVDEKTYVNVYSNYVQINKTTPDAITINANILQYRKDYEETIEWAKNDIDYSKYLSDLEPLKTNYLVKNNVLVISMYYSLPLPSTGDGTHYKTYFYNLKTDKELQIKEALPLLGHKISEFSKYNISSFEELGNLISKGSVEIDYTIENGTGVIKNILDCREGCAN